MAAGSTLFAGSLCVFLSVCSTPLCFAKDIAVEMP